MGKHLDLRIAFFEKLLGKACWEWKGKVGKNGYGYFRVNGKDVYAHRWSYDYFNRIIGIGPDMCVCHKCDNPKCIRPDHLFLGTRADNVRDRDLKGRVAWGEKQWMSKLKEKDVLKIRALYQSGNWTQISLAKQFKVSRPLISQVVGYKRWARVS